MVLEVEKAIIEAYDALVSWFLHKIFEEVDTEQPIDS